MNDFDSVELLNYFVRIFARVGFGLFLIGLYRIYLLFASPLVRRHHSKFIKVISICTVTGFGLLALEYLLSLNWMSTVSMVFNTITLYAIVFYIFNQVKLWEPAQATSEFARYRDAMDALIFTLKSR